MPKRDSTRRTTRVPRLLERVIQQRRKPEPRGEPAGLAEVDTEGRLAALEQRVQHLEALLEGLQDSVHRAAARQEREIKSLERKTEPSELARALSKDRRERGL